MNGDGVSSGGAAVTQYRNGETRGGDWGNSGGGKEWGGRGGLLNKARVFCALVGDSKNEVTSMPTPARPVYLFGFLYVFMLTDPD